MRRDEQVCDIRQTCDEMDKAIVLSEHGTFVMSSLNTYIKESLYYI